VPRSRRSPTRVRDETVSYEVRPSASALSLLEDGSDRAFQRLIFNLFTLAARLEQVRVHFASRMGISGPQYSLLRAVASLQGREGVSIGIVAEHLHVTSAFITAQSRLLAERGLVHKQDDTTDRRVSRLSLTAKGEHLVNEIIEEIRPINDLFFGGLRKQEFRALSSIMEKLIDSSRAAVVQITAQDRARALSNRDARPSR